MSIQSSFYSITGTWLTIQWEMLFQVWICNNNYENDKIKMNLDKFWFPDTKFLSEMSGSKGTHFQVFYTFYSSNQHADTNFVWHR